MFSWNFLLVTLIIFFNASLHAQQFTKVAQANFVKLGNSKAVFGDFDNDDDLDIFICGTDNLNQDTSILYRNDGGNSFTDMLQAIPGVDYGSAAWGDYDNDGDLDLLLSGRSNITSRITHLYRNDGGTFTKTNDAFTGLAYCSVSFHDYDNDGDQDIFTGGSDIDNKKVSIIYRNNKGSFQADSIPSIVGLDQGMAAWGDYNNDGLSDLIISGSSDANTRITRIYKNNGNRTFTAINVPGLSNIISSSLAWGDYDNDGDLDILLAGLDNLSNHVCKIYRNTGGNTFNQTSTAALTGVSSGSAVWGDYDNDGWLDILTSGFNGTVANTKVYKNNSDHTFTALTFTEAGLPNTFSGISLWGDFDKDLDLDVFITGFGITGLISELYQNTTSTVNLIPSSPSGLTEVTDDDKVILSWEPASDNSTSSKALTYNLWVGTSKEDNISILSPNSNTASAFFKLAGIGNGNTDTSAIIKDLPQGKYYWSVQTVDNSYHTSLFAHTDSFSICRKFNLGNDTIVCNKDTITLHAGTAGETVNWFKATGSGVIAMNQLQIKEAVVQKDTIWANIINTVAGCSTFDTILVVPDPVSIITAGNDTSICFQKEITLGGNPTAQGSLLDYTYEWSPSNLLDDPFRSNPVANLETSTQFRLIVKAGQCTSDTAFVNISVNALPLVSVSADTTIGPGETAQLFASGGIDYTWSPGNGLSNSLIANPIATPTESIEYLIKGTDINGCADTASVMVHVINRLFIPTLFSPDNNQQNDVFKIYGTGIKEIDFRIYNRQGQEVFSSTDWEKLSQTGWDGKYQGEAMASQTLVWTINGKYFDDSEITFNGKKTGILMLKK